MNSTWIIIFIILFIVLTQQNTIRTVVSKNRIKRTQRKRGKFIMTQEMMSRIIGKEIIIYSISNSTAKGIVLSIEDGWIEIKTKAQQHQYLSIDYVVGIVEQKPKTK